MAHRVKKTENTPTWVPSGERFADPELDALDLQLGAMRESDLSGWRPGPLLLLVPQDQLQPALSLWTACR